MDAHKKTFLHQSMTVWWQWAAFTCEIEMVARKKSPTLILVMGCLEKTKTIWLSS